MHKQKKQNRIFKTMRATMRNTRSKIRSCTNTVAVIMVLFLLFIAAILYLNDKFLSENKPMMAVSSTTSTVTETAINKMVTLQPFGPSPALSDKPTISGSPVSIEVTPVPTSELDITPIQDSSSISETLEFSPVTISPKPLSAPNLPVKEPSPVPSITTIPFTYPTPTAVNKLSSPPTPSISLKPTPIPQISPTTIPVTPSASPVLTSPAKKTAENKVLIVIDPGHGGIDPGTCSIYKKGIYEKDINLDIGLKLKTLLESSEIPVLLTRESDTEVYQSTKYDYDENIHERPRIANRNNATLFVSIHVNAYDTKLPGGEQHNGTEIYHAGKTHGVFTSNQFAEIMGKAIDKKTETNYNGTVKKNFGVLRLSNMPALLIETAYLTNKEDHKRLETSEFRSAMSEGIYDGIIEILKTMGAYKKNEIWCISVKD